MQYKIIAFDLDGVIIDSLKNMEFSWNKTSQKNNLNISFQKYKKYIGIPFKIILNKLNIKKNLNRISDDYSNFSNMYVEKIKLYPKILAVLKKIKKNYLISIITSKDLIRSKKIIKYFKIPCDFLITPELVAKGKPHKDSFLLLKKKFNAKTKEILFIGDTNVDYYFAKNCKINFLFASWGYEKIKKKCQKIKKPSDIIKIL
jgi:HAD superfamily hydrolase (TIGR01549 family)